ncbi:hypothetical protein BDK92_6754 [Micromonospora pisi]|uniref:Uncharacterized protein n=1 Tax=Micromonospora pisi TaxID=589240 RepID=A0A495JTJ5_9ACTN|nr:hypothetical protein [Micromonospora pisi]RKR92316.1 hypothetical protein BDK92_6754 [Micromonospora pisi]
MTRVTDGRAVTGGETEDGRPGSGDQEVGAGIPVAGESSRSLVKVTVNLTPRAVDALELACARTRDTKTDTINRALVVYNLVLELMERGGGSLTLQNSDGGTERVHLL